MASLVFSGLNGVDTKEGYAYSNVYNLFLIYICNRNRQNVTVINMQFFTRAEKLFTMENHAQNQVSEFWGKITKDCMCNVVT